MENNQEKKTRLYALFMSKVFAWIMVVVSIFVLVMEMLSSFRFYITDVFSKPNTLLISLFITFLAWTIRSFLESFDYPTYKKYILVFFILSMIAGYLLTTRLI